jgi:hypothetical protein
VTLIRFFLLPTDRLIRTDELADSTDVPPIEPAQPAIGTALGAVQFRNNYSPFIRSFARTENAIRAYLNAEVAALTAVRVNDQLHESSTSMYRTGKKIYVLIQGESPKWQNPGIPYPLRP